MAGSLDNVWNRVLELLQSQIQKPTYETWIRPTKALSVEGSSFIIGVPHVAAKEWLESRYTTIIRNALEQVTGEEFELDFVVAEATQPEEASIRISPVNAPSAVAPDHPVVRSNTVLNPKYTFESFVVGNSNRFAHAAALAVAESPAKAYNPLFIYGGVGLGKTHLMQAIGHYVLARDPSTRVVYVSSETFTNEIIGAIKSGDTRSFKSKYRDVDVLMIDDIQFIAGRERTQEEFFHTFNSLYEAGRQIIISSDRPPKEIPTLEDRLRSRFESGLITDIQAPDLETRIAILKKKADDENLRVPNDVIVFIANQIHSNIRELEGALIRVIAYSSLIDNEITMDIAKQVLKDIIPSDKPKTLSIEYVMQIVCEYFGIRTDELKSKKRTKTVTYPRQVAMYLSRELTDASLSRIGEEFGGRDHTTVIHACDKIQADSQRDAELGKAIKEIIDRLRSQ